MTTPRRHAPEARAGERGSATIWMIGVTTASFLMIGLVLDGGVMLRARSDAFSIAGAAARIGAQQLDADAAVEGLVQLDPDGAEQAALDHLAAHGLAGTVTVTPERITVTVTATAELQLLRVAGGGRVEFQATASSEPIKVPVP